MKKESADQQPKRSLLCFDLARPWALAGRDVQKKYYPDLPSFTALIRHALMELIASHFTEEELKKRGLLAPYQSGQIEVLVNRRSGGWYQCFRAKVSYA